MANLKFFSRSLLVLGALLAPASGPLSAQEGSVRVLIVDDETGDPVVGAVLKIKNRPDATTDEAGRAVLEGLPVGRIELEIRAIGYLARRDYLGVQAGPQREQRFGLSFTGEQLPEVVVNARREKLAGRYQDFHRRQVAGNGVFITWQEIADRRYTRLGDAIRNVRGVRVNCRTHDCLITMARSTSCPAAIWLDGTESPQFGPNTPIGDVYGIEVYRGSGEMPAEYAGTSACGAIVIWTKNRPYK
jgi:hypothetical protein